MTRGEQFRLDNEPPETWIEGYGDGVEIVCVKPRCQFIKGFCGRFPIDGLHLQPKDIDKAFMEHKVAHSS